MKTKLFITTLIAIAFAINGFSQNEQKAASKALKQINKTLKQASKDTDYLLEVRNSYASLALENMDSYRAKVEEVDSVLSVCGIIKDEHLNVRVLREAMEKIYDMQHEDNDTASAYYQLLDHLHYLEANPQVFQELSPVLQYSAIEMIIPEELRQEKFYAVMDMLMLQGIGLEFRKGLNQYLKEKKLNEAKEEVHEGLEVLSIVEDDVEIEDIELEIYEPEEEETPEEDIFYIVQKMPVYPGGEDALKKYLQLTVPDHKGKIYVQFVIDKRGAVRDERILRGMDEETDRKVLKLLRSMPDWTPGEQIGQKVNVQTTQVVLINRE